MPVVQSSNIRAIEWDEQTSTLTVQFHGGIYQYGGVPKQVYEEFLAAGSKGQYFHRVIKPNFAASRVA